MLIKNVLYCQLVRCLVIKILYYLLYSKKIVVLAVYIVHV